MLATSRSTSRLEKHGEIEQNWSNVLNVCNNFPSKCCAIKKISSLKMETNFVFTDIFLFIHLRWILSVNSLRDGNVSISGQMWAFGVPKRSIIKSNWFISLRPGNKGLWASNSPKQQPADHMSILVVWFGEFSNNSGLRYHKVTTLGVKKSVKSRRYIRGDSC
jgi:hypothetical protein